MKPDLFIKTTAIINTILTGSTPRGKTPRTPGTPGIPNTPNTARSVIPRGGTPKETTTGSSPSKFD